jgi:hypothetical protein
MSTPRGCDVVELDANKWFCIVANEEHDYDFESFTVYGPARDSDAAFDMMSDRESNPGGLCTFKRSDVTDQHREMIRKSGKR